MIKEIFPKLDLLVVTDISMTPTAEYADILLPGSTLFESTELCPWGFPYLQLAPKIIDPIEESKPEFWIFRELGKKMGFGSYLDFTEEKLLEELLKLPQAEGITLDALRRGPVNVIRTEAPYIMFSDKRFSTPSGRMEFYAENYAKLGEALPLHKESLESNRSDAAKECPLTLFTTHTRYRYHSNFQTSRWMRELNRGPQLEISPQDAELRGIRNEDIVLVRNDRGRCRLKANVNAGMRPGLVNITEGWWMKEFLEGSHQHLTHDRINEAQEMIGLANMPYYDVLVQVEKA